MTKNEKRLLYILFWLLVVAAFLISTISFVGKIQEEKKEAQLYTASLQKLKIPNDTQFSRAKQQWETEQKKQIKTDSIQQTMTISVLAHYMLTELQRYKINPEQYRITGTPPDESVEFLLHCAPMNFFKFLDYEQNAKIPLQFTYIAVTPDQRENLITVSFRTQNEK